MLLLNSYFKLCSLGCVPGNASQSRMVKYKSRHWTPSWSSVKNPLYNQKGRGRFDPRLGTKIPHAVEKLSPQPTATKMPCSAGRPNAAKYINIQNFKAGHKTVFIISTLINTQWQLCLNEDWKKETAVVVIWSGTNFYFVYTSPSFTVNMYLCL